MVAGVGMTLFFVPLASLVLGSVPQALEGVASGTNAAFRELGGVLGIAVLGVVFTSHGGYASGQDYVNGMTAAVYVAAAVVAVGALAAMVVPNRRAGSGEAGRVLPQRAPIWLGRTASCRRSDASDRYRPRQCKTWSPPGWCSPRRLTGSYPQLLCSWCRRLQLSRW